MVLSCLKLFLRLVSETLFESLSLPNPLLAFDKETTSRHSQRAFRLVTGVTKASRGKVRAFFRFGQCLVPEACEAVEAYKASDWEASMIVGVASWMMWSADKVPQCPCSLRSGGRGTLWNGRSGLEGLERSCTVRANTSTKFQLMVRILYRHFTGSSCWKCPG